MSRLVALLMSAALAALAAGCAQPRDPGADEAGLVDDGEFEGLEASQTTGVIRGVVVDEAIRPLAGATITLAGDAPRQATTSDAGAFGFDGLQPGTYFLQASRVGYAQIQQSVEVLAGDDEPPVTKVVLARLAGFQPYYIELGYEGFIECTTSFVVLCGAPNLLTGENITNDRYTWTWFFDPNGTWLQAEMAWDSSQPLTPTMYFEMEPDGECDEGFFNSTEGTSPIYATLNATAFEEGPLGPDCGIYFSLFSGHNEPLPPWPVTGWGWGVTVQQRFQMFTHAFYDFLPEPGWRFTSHGSPTVPEA